MWPNGLELRKATLGRGRNFDNTDLTPDEELINAVWGWDGKVGCFHAYIPAERPVFGREAYAKLLPWQQHCEMMRAIVRSGIPAMTYGVILGLPDDDRDELARLEEVLWELYYDLKNINPDLDFGVVAQAIMPIPGTPQGFSFKHSDLLKVTDPTIVGGLWFACADTHHLSYQEVADWQVRLVQIGRTDSKYMSSNGGQHKRKKNSLKMC
ncbi:MAG: hypothetical protein WBA93_21790 [Microcoleaceae cyanobacterium]